MCDVCGLDSFLRLKVDEKRTFFGSYTIKRGVTSIETSVDLFKTRTDLCSYRDLIDTSFTQKTTTTIN